MAIDFTNTYLTQQLKGKKTYIRVNGHNPVSQNLRTTPLFTF